MCALSTVSQCLSRFVADDAVSSPLNSSPQHAIEGGSEDSSYDADWHDFELRRHQAEEECHETDDE